jgi:hypothetical protein
MALDLPIWHKQSPFIKQNESELNLLYCLKWFLLWINAHKRDFYTTSIIFKRDQNITKYYIEVFTLAIEIEKRMSHGGTGGMLGGFIKGTFP